MYSSFFDLGGVVDEVRAQRLPFLVDHTISRMRLLKLATFLQDISVANPPTLLLLVDSLLRDLPEPTSDNGNTASPIVFTVHADGDRPAPPQGCSTPPLAGDQEPVLEEFLRTAYPLLDLWVRWLLITQRPGATGWGGQAKGAPLGAFQVFCNQFAFQHFSFCCLPTLR